MKTRHEQKHSEKDDRKGPSHAPRGPQSHRDGTVLFLYEDEDLLVVEKPAGLPTIAPEGSRARNLYDIVTMHLQKRNPKARAAVVHRLDRETSGILVFAKHARSKKALMDGWNALVRTRKYRALVEGSMPAPSGILESWLLEDEHWQVREVEAERRGALRAVTRWNLLEAGPSLSLLELQLETGRKHQIRVQLAAMGHPVSGDRRYGDRNLDEEASPCGRLALHASVLEFTHPFSGERLHFESAMPEVFGTALRSWRKALQRGEEKSQGWRQRTHADSKPEMDTRSSWPPQRGSRKPESVPSPKGYRKGPPEGRSEWHWKDAPPDSIRKNAAMSQEDRPGRFSRGYAESHREGVPNGRPKGHSKGYPERQGQDHRPDSVPEPRWQQPGRRAEPERRPTFRASEGRFGSKRAPARDEDSRTTRKPASSWASDSGPDARKSSRFPDRPADRASGHKDGMRPLRGGGPQRTGFGTGKRD